MIGMTVGTARSTWQSAGFTGAFTPKTQNGRVVTGQNRPAGDCLATSTTVVVTYK